MNKIVSEISKIGWRFDNTYSKLPDSMMSKLSPIPVKKPELVILNNSLSKELGLDFSSTNEENLSLMFAGNLLPKGILNQLHKLMLVINLVILLC